MKRKKVVGTCRCFPMGCLTALVLLNSGSISTFANNTYSTFTSDFGEVSVDASLQSKKEMFNLCICVINGVFNIPDLC